MVQANANLVLWRGAATAFGSLAATILVKVFKAERMLYFSLMMMDVDDEMAR